MVKMKRYLIFCLCILIVFTSVRFDYVKVEAASESDIVQWLNSQKGKAIDFDGSYGVQCVDFFNYYLKNYWGYQNPIGMYPVSYAYQIFDRDQPSGWQKISGNSNFRTGDIVVWNSSVGKGAGHVGVIYSVDSSGVKVAHENWGAKYVTITSLPSVNSIRGVFRPPLTTPNPSSCNCSTSYAGTYTVITTQYPLNLRSGHGTNYSSITTIPIGAEVTVTKGDGSWAHVEWNGFSGYCAMEYLKKKSGTGNPIGTVDSLNGGANSISLAGWAFDSDDLNAGLEIHVYIGEECHPIVANLERKDVHNVYGCGNNHGFAATINTERTGRQNIRVYAINVGSGDNVLLMSKDVDISVDSNPPKITRTYVSEVTRDSYRVCAEISDDNGVKKVSIATWSQEKQADLIWRDAKYNGAGTYYIDISRSEHSQILNSFYYNHIYAYDYANNGARASQDMDYRVTSNTGKNISDGEYRIVSAADESKALNVLDEGTTAGTNIDINSNLSNKNQTFDITYIDNGFYKIIGHKSGLALDVNGDTYKLESNVVLSGYHDGMNQQWIFKKSSEGIYSIISRSTGMALDIYKGKYENGTNVEMYNVQDSDNQHWKLRRVLKENMVTFSDNNIYASNYTSYLDKVSVKVNGVKLKKNTDYKISCSKSGNVVRYEITGIGNYCDTVSKSVELKNEPTTSKVADPLEISLAGNHTTVNKREKVTLTATVKGGTPEYTYRYSIINKETGRKANLTGFVKNNTYVWTAANAGKRELFVEVKDASGNTVKSNSVNVVCLDDLSVKLTAPATEVKKGSTLKITAQATGGASGYTYRYSIINKETGRTAAMTGFVKNNTYTWTAANTGERELFVEVKDATGKIVKSNSLNIVCSGELSVKLTAPATEVKKGSTLKVTAQATGGASGYTYRYSIINKETGRTAAMTGFVKNNTYTWTAANTGKRQLYVEVKDTTGKIVKSSAVNLVVK